MSSRLMTVTGLATVAAIALAWSALAADGGEGDGNEGAESGHRWEFPAPPGAEGEVMPAPPHPRVHVAPGGPLGSDGGELTWGELHVQRDGEAVTLRIDHGEIAAVDSDSILVAENDGNEVEIPVDEGTEVMTGPFDEGEATVDDLDEGETVHVVREEGGAAEKIGVLPNLEDLERRFE
jgi:hypothetical protein